MKKKELMDMLHNQKLENELDEECKNSILQIECLLFVLPDATEINLLHDFFKKGFVIENFINENSNEKIKKSLDHLLNSIQNWTYNNKKTIRKIVSKNKSKKRNMIIFISIMVFFIMCAFTLTLLKVFEILQDDDQKLSIIFDGLGLMTGLGFFLYERIDDAKKEKLIISDENNEVKTPDNYVNLSGLKSSISKLNINQTNSNKQNANTSNVVDLSNADVNDSTIEIKQENR